MFEKGSPSEQGNPASHIPYIPFTPVSGAETSAETSSEIAPPSSPEELPDSLTGVRQLPYATYIEEVGSQTATFFYRKDTINAQLLGNTIAPAIMEGQPPEKVFRVLDAGCSRGHDTWSLASVLSHNGINYRIDGVDANGIMIAAAQRPFLKSPIDLNKDIANWKGMPTEVVRFFEEVGAGRMQPSAELRERVSFYLANLLEPLPIPHEYDAAVCNKMLMYYVKSSGEVNQKMHRIIGNIANKLAPGGLFTFSDGEWVQSLEDVHAAFAQHGLMPAENSYGIPDEQWRKMSAYSKIATEDTP